MFSKKPKNSFYIDVNLPKLRQEIVIGSNLQEWILEEISLRNYSRLIIFVDNNFANLYAEWFSQIKKTLAPKEIIIIEASEKSKSSEFLNCALEKCFDAGINRKSCIIAIGGGIVGDIAGFFASVYMRGVDFIFVPTTLMAQADTIINKVAISYKMLKNIIGSFYSPVLTVCNTNFLRTLSKNEISLGLSEIIKHAFIKSPAFVKYLGENLHTNLSGWEKYPWEKIIYRSLLIKSKIVEKDPLDNNEIHKGLSYGHTFANALEGLSDFKFRHGEAVSLGMHASALVSRRLGILSIKEFEKQKELLQRVGLPVQFPGVLKKEKVIDFMSKDKICVDCGLSIVILEKIGKFKICKNIDSEIIKSALSVI